MTKTVTLTEPEGLPAADRRPGLRAGLSGWSSTRSTPSADRCSTTSPSGGQSRGFARPDGVCDRTSRPARSLAVAAVVVSHVGLRATLSAVTDDELADAWEAGAVFPGGLSHLEHLRIAWVLNRRHGPEEAGRRLVSGTERLRGPWLSGEVRRRADGAMGPGDRRGGSARRPWPYRGELHRRSPAAAARRSVRLT
jgi:hypothetical protein